MLPCGSRLYRMTLVQMKTQKIVSKDYFPDLEDSWYKKRATLPHTLVLPPAVAFFHEDISAVSLRPSPRVFVKVEGSLLPPVRERRNLAIQNLHRPLLEREIDRRGSSESGKDFAINCPRIWDAISDLRSMVEPANTIFIAFEEDMEEALLAAKMGVRTFTSDWLMNCVMTQELDQDAYQFAESL
ncbi:hypothetical protein KSP39_PZI023348 [Platanthera zijinensis]|uniref:BRCT domain-containing protein n=1 Tax=Platanthera zijinensis TaxID=2320716 RepID=A0AAP0AW72_9ASPA